MAVGARLPDVPVMVMAAVPVEAEPLMVRLMVLVELVEAGLNVALTPAGRLDADKATLLEKPFAGTTVTVTVPLAFCCKVTLLGDDERVKLGGGGGGGWMLDCPPPPQAVIEIDKRIVTNIQAVFVLKIREVA